MAEQLADVLATEGRRKLLRPLTAGKLLNDVSFGQGNQKLGGNSLLSVAMEILGKLLREASSGGDGITQNLLREGFWLSEQ